MYDEVCTLCGATDAPGINDLRYECPRGNPRLKDYLGQNIYVGSKILWSGGKGMCSGFEKIFEVLAISTQQITIQREQPRRRTSINPKSVIVIDKLLS